MKKLGYVYDLTERERELLETLAELPPEVQDKFLLMAQGAVIGLECAKASEAKASEAKDDTGDAAE